MVKELIAPGTLGKILPTFRTLYTSLKYHTVGGTIKAIGKLDDCRDLLEDTVVLVLPGCQVGMAGFTADDSEITYMWHRVLTEDGVCGWVELCNDTYRTFLYEVVPPPQI